MLYLWPGSSSMRSFSSRFGVLSSPSKWTVEAGIREGRWWAMDNAAFKNGFEPVKFFAHLTKLEPYRDRCLFVVVPDCVGDANATLALWTEWTPQITGWPLAFVAQDKQEYLPYPPGCTWIFIGGTDDFKLGVGGRVCIERALAEGKYVHVGRVNSKKRYQMFERMGVHSCDGTGPTRAPDNYFRLLHAAMVQPSFFRVALPDRDHSG